MKLRQVTKYNDFVILTDGKDYYVANYFDEYQRFLGAFRTWQGAEAYIASIYGDKPWSEMRRTQK